MLSIILSLQTHRGAERIFASFGYEEAINKIIKAIPGAQYSRTKRNWHLPVKKEILKMFAEQVKHIAVIDAQQLKQQLANKKSLPAVINKSAENNAATRTPVTAKLYITALAPANQKALQQYLQHLALKAYSASTIKTYKSEFSVFLQALGNTTAESLGAQRLKDYLQYCYSELRLSENTLHSRINALKFYYEQVLHREKFFWEIPRPKRGLLIPRMFSLQDVEKILKSAGNLKHKTALLLCYSSGLRVSEVVALKVSNIDSKRMVINILAAKGKKDRIVPLSKTALKYLRAYYKQYKPGTYLFEGQCQGEAWSARSLQKVFNNIKVTAKINKPGGIHALRHSYATHLLDKGVDITYIQKLLGHNDLTTTLRYLHVTVRDLSKIESPAEDLDI